MKTVTLLQDPSNRGGILTVSNWYSRWMKTNNKSYNSFYLDDFGKHGLVNLLKWDRTSQSIPKYLPRMHFPMYFAAKYRMKATWQEAEEVHVIGASCMHGSLIYGKHPYLVWLATTISDERLSTLALQSTSKRYLYRFTLPFLESIERKVLQHASKVLAMSPHTAEIIADSGTVSPDQLSIRTVPIDTDLFAMPPEGSNRKGVLFVGRANDPRKGFQRIEHLIESSKLVRLVGVDAVSSNFGFTTGSLRWHGQIDDLAEFYKRAAVLAMPSVQEGLGIVAFEALSCGTPVVAYRCGGSDKLLEESKGAILVDNQSQFQDAVESILNDTKLRTSMGMLGRQYIEDNFSAKAFLSDKSLFTINK